MIKNLFIILFTILLSLNIVSQKGLTQFGFQYKPILPIEVLNVENLSLTNNDFSANVAQQYGFNFGGIIRWNILKSVSLESGVNYVKRNFKYTTNVQSTNQASEGSFGIVGYEVPIKGMVNVRINDKSYINVSTGISTSWTASNVASTTEDDLFYQIAFTKKMNLALIANVGYEFRSREAGTYYLGVSLNNPFQSLGLIDVVYDEFNQQKQTITGELQGSYVTLDLRYYFHEKKEKKKKK